MNLEKLENLLKTGQLKQENFNQNEFNGLLNSGLTRLQDAKNETLSPESRFDLAYNAAHSLALASLRWRNYRPSTRYIVFQSLPHTLGVGPEIWRVLSKCHDTRNLSEYEGFSDLDEQLLSDLLTATQILANEVKKLNDE